jgi:hypothetical protein
MVNRNEAPIIRAPAFYNNGSRYLPTVDQGGNIVLDNALLELGTNQDIALVLNSAGLSADATLTGVIVNSPDHQGVAANSLIISNITTDGDIIMLVNDGGNSKEFLLANGDTADLVLGHGMATATIKTASGDLTLSPGGAVISTKDIRSHAARPALQLSETDGSADENWEANVGGGVLNIATQNDAFGAASTKLSITQAGVVDLKNGALNSVGAAGNDWTSAGITVDGSSNSTIQRSNTSTGSNVATMRIKADTSNDMSDGYGAQLIWTNRDSADVNNDVGYMVFQMAGADNTSDFVLATRITGSVNEAFKVSSTGIGSFDLAGDGNGAPSLFDEYDDATELQRFAYASEGVEDVVPEVTEEQRLANRERMVEMGIFEEVSGASSGYHMRIQPLMNLLAGGIYQNRHRMDSQYEQLNKRLEAIGA